MCFLELFQKEKDKILTPYHTTFKDRGKKRLKKDSEEFHNNSVSFTPSAVPERVEG